MAPVSDAFIWLFFRLINGLLPIVDPPSRSACPAGGYPPTDTGFQLAAAGSSTGR